MLRLTSGYVYFSLTALALVWSLGFFGQASHAEISKKLPKNCDIPTKQIESGVSEVNFGSVRAKFEQYRKIAKMKLVSRLNEDWTSVNLEQGGIGQISGFLGNGDSAELLSELVVVAKDNEFDWAMFVKDPKGLGGSIYFVMEGQPACARSTVIKWKASVRKSFGEIKNVAYINLDRDQL